MDFDLQDNSELAKLKIGSLIAGRYEICEQRGFGAMGLVCRVIDRSLDNEVVALKILYPYLVKDSVTFGRFRNEVLIARKLTHPAIVRTYDFGTSDEGYHYISMEYVDGGSLDKRIYDHRFDRLSFQAILEILRTVAAGLAYAHRQGVIHRDLKPDNLLVSKLGEVKIGDFGLAQTLGVNKGLTETGKAVGTPYYMSPEQIQGEPLDARCDIYALGIIAYEMVVGERPFQDESWYKIAALHVLEPIPAISSKVSGIPKWYEDFVFKATAKHRDDRFATAAEIVELLDRKIAELRSTEQAAGSKGDSSTRHTSGGAIVPTRMSKREIFWKKVYAVAIPVFLVLFALVLATLAFNKRARLFVVSQLVVLEQRTGLDFSPVKAVFGTQTSYHLERFFSHIEQGQVELVAVLLGAGFDPNAKDQRGQPALSVAVQGEKLQVVKLLLHAGANPNVADEEGVTPLMLAVKRNFVDGIKLLISAGADLNAADKRGWRPMNYAIDAGNVPLVSSFLEIGADPNGKTIEGKTTLMHAVERDNYRLVELLLDRGVDVNARNTEGAGALSIATQRGNFSIVQQILRHGADVNGADRSGMTALMHAARIDNVTMVQELLKFGADPNLETLAGYAALDYTLAREGSPVSTLLRKYGAKTRMERKAHAPQQLSERVSEGGVGGVPPEANALGTATTAISPGEFSEMERSEGELKASSAPGGTHTGELSSEGVQRALTTPEHSTTPVDEPSPPPAIQFTRLRSEKPVGVWRRTNTLQLLSLKARVRNIGFSTAENVVVTVTLPGGRVIKLDGPSSLEPNQVAEYTKSKLEEIVSVEGRLKVNPTCSNCHR